MECCCLIDFWFIMPSQRINDYCKTQFNDPYYYLKQQLLKGVLLGIIGFVVAMFLSPKFYKKATPVLFIISLVLTILVFTPLGLELNGARRWIDVGFLTFQPNEIF